MRVAVMMVSLSFCAVGCSGAVMDPTGSAGAGQQGSVARDDAGDPGAADDAGGASVDASHANDDAAAPSHSGDDASTTDPSTPVSCTLPNGDYGATSYGTCVPIVGCDPTGAHPPDAGINDWCQECPCTCAVVNDGWSMTTDQNCDTPLVLAFAGEPVTFTRASGSFDLAGREASFGGDWVSAATPWLAIDLDGNGAIDDGRELFGSMTELPNGERAKNGFDALAALDSDRDGRITADDPSFARLVVWRDSDQDRASEAGELRSASDEGLVAIDLDYGVAPRCMNGGCEVERARFTWRDASGATRLGAVVDVHVARK